MANINHIGMYSGEEDIESSSLSLRTDISTNISVMYYLGTKRKERQTQIYIHEDLIFHMYNIKEGSMTKKNAQMCPNS